MKNVGIMGVGRVGSALAYALESSGYNVTVVARQVPAGGELIIKTRKFRAVPLRKIGQETDMLFITTPDGVISNIVEQLQCFNWEGKVVLHMSGAQSSQLLSPLQAKGALIGSLHPLQSFANVEQAIANLPGSYFTYEGDIALFEEMQTLVKKLGGVLKILPSPEAKAIYHAGACFASNYVVALAGMGAQCLCAAGFTEEEASKALLPLMQGTLNNLAQLPLTVALTGPFSRGDTEVVEKHIRVLAQENPVLKRMYCVLAFYLAKLAYTGGRISEEQYQIFLKMINEGQQER